MNYNELGNKEIATEHGRTQWLIYITRSLAHIAEARIFLKVLTGEWGLTSSALVAVIGSTIYTRQCTGWKTWTPDNRRAKGDQRMSKHTPGPWEWVGDTLEALDYATVIGIEQSSNGHELGLASLSMDNEEHDRPLVAAAPELAEAVKFMLSAINNPNPDAADHVAAAEEKARAALRKTGLLEGGKDA